jgi:hypothetical protein
MEILNVLIKGVEKKNINICQAFFKEEEMDKWIDYVCSLRNWTIKSRLGWNEDKDIDDRRVEDKDGNTYYFVIYKQTIL